MASDIPPESLRERLLQDELAAMITQQKRWSAGRTATATALAGERADRTAAVVAAWLRDKAAALRALAEAAENSTGRTIMVIRAEQMGWAADEIDPPKGDETCSSTPTA